MKCPFPGMDPYLENPATWADFHNRFLTYMCEAIAARLPDRYDARLEEQIRVIEAPPVEAGGYRPDLSITGAVDWPAETERSVEAVAVLDPTVVVPLGETILEEVREVCVKIYRWPGDELVTAIELLSPWNKTGDGYGEFQRKRRALLMSPVNWVEIDLLIGGERIPLGGPTPPDDYRVVISRATANRNAAVYSWNVRQVLPSIPIPLRQPDVSIPIALGEVFAMTYERARLDKALRRLPPGQPLVPLRPEDRAWAVELASGR